MTWQLPLTDDYPDWFLQAVQAYTPGLSGRYAAQLLWQRGIRDAEQLAGFVDVNHYQPTSPFAFGDEMTWAIARLQQAHALQETVAIWGDFDADGITATAVLWDGLKEFFALPGQLVYHIPNRLRESHGLAIAGLNALHQQGCRLIITCDTGSTNLAELDYAQQLGLDVIVTDHHVLPDARPPVTAIINPRSLPVDHPLAYLSGVAVAYKLVEALYQTLPTVPTRPLEALLDLVAIGLIADLVELRGDCRYLAQRGIERLQLNQGESAPRPGVARLLELCKKSGDRPSDISFGVGPRINAISRIQGDAHFAVELLTSQDRDRCRQLAEETELANARRRSLQRDVEQQVKRRLAQLDLSTTHVIVLADPQWPIGILGLVAGQIAQQYGRPTVLLSIELVSSELTTLGDTAPDGLAKGSARSVGAIDLYQLFQHQAHLLHRFGGHPLAAGLSLPVENLPLFTEAINREVRQLDARMKGTDVTVDLVVTVAELGRALFQELRLLEPYGMGNSPPKLLIKNCWFRNVAHKNINDWRGKKVRYIKTEFSIWDETVQQGFPGVWWGHYRDEIPPIQCDAIAELESNPYTRRYEIRLLAVQPAPTQTRIATDEIDWLLDWRSHSDLDSLPLVDGQLLRVTRCPCSWDELQIWFRQAIRCKKQLAIAYPPPQFEDANTIWSRLLGLAKYLSRTGDTATRSQLLERLQMSDRTLDLAFESLELLGFEIVEDETNLYISQQGSADASAELTLSLNQLKAAIQEEQFRCHYFYQVPLTTLKAAAHLETIAT